MRIDALGPVLSTRHVVIATGDTVQTAAIAFSNPRIGLLVACDENGKAVGVVSKSDLVSHLTTAGVAGAPVATLMSRTIVSCTAPTTISMPYGRSWRHGAFRTCPF